MAPSKRALVQLSPSSQTAATAVKPAVSSTPSDASTRAGFKPVRNRG